jgi:hypothetical protein
VNATESSVHPLHGTAPPVGLRARGPVAMARAITLVAMMAVGSVALWIGAPFAWIWFASQLQNGPQPSFGPYLAVAAGMPTTMFMIGKFLAMLDRSFSNVTGYNRTDNRVPRPWLKSMRGERGSAHKRTVLDIVMMVSVAIAGLAMAVWFFGFAHSGNPLG